MTDVHATAEIDGVQVKWTFALEGARRVAEWSPSEARLHLGHDVGNAIQMGIRSQLADLDG